MFTAILFIISPNDTHSKCPSIGEQINKFCYIQIQEYYLAKKENILLMLVTKIDET